MSAIYVLARAIGSIGPVPLELLAGSDILDQMRITLDIADDVLQVARDLAATEGRTTGAVLSDLARRGLRAGSAARSGGVRNGVEVLPSRGETVSLGHVHRLMGDEGD